MGRTRDESWPANYLRAWREHRGLTQSQLAESIGTEGSVISLLESGDRGLSDKWLRRLAPPLGTTPGILLDFHPEAVDEAQFEHWSRVRDAQNPQLRSMIDSVPAKAETSRQDSGKRVVKLRVSSRDKDQAPTSKRDKKR